MTIDYYPRYQPKPQATTCSSVIKMILALQTKPACFKPFLSRIGKVLNFITFLILRFQNFQSVKQ